MNHVREGYRDVQNGSDKQRLTDAAAALVEALKTKINGSPLRFKRSPRLETVDTAGWGIVLATMGTDLPSVQVWLDCLSGRGGRDQDAHQQSLVPGDRDHGVLQARRVARKCGLEPPAHGLRNSMIADRTT
jgi:hypothetical protein